MRYQILIIVALLIVFAGCESGPDESGSPVAGNETADLSSDTPLTGIDTTEIPRPSVPGQDEPGAYADGSADRDDDGSALLGISLQRLIDAAHHRSPGEQELAVLDQLHDPNRVTTDTRANRHVPGQTDTLRTRHYETARITVYHVSGGKELLHSVEVTGPELKSPEGLRVGMTRTEIESAMGEPPEHQNGAYIYPQNGPMPRRLHVHLQNDVVSRLEWRLPID